jgi:transcriptional regulator with XRE-family HTH domain
VADEQRACRICGYMKSPPEEIGYGIPTCKECSAERNAARARARYLARRGVPEGERVCQWCGYAKQIGEAIAPNAEFCFECKAERKRGMVRYRYRKKQEAMTDAERAAYRKRDAAWARAKRSTPEGKARDHAAVKRWRKENPEAYREADRRRRKKIAADPERHEEFLANRRINYRLRAQREGRKVRELSHEAYANGNGKPHPKGGHLPTGPLGEVISAWIGEIGGKFLTGAYSDDNFNAAGYAQLADLTGVSDRTLRAIARGERELVQYATADAIATGLDTPLALLYPDL